MMGALVRQLQQQRNGVASPGLNVHRLLASGIAAAAADSRPSNGVTARGMATRKAAAAASSGEPVDATRVKEEKPRVVATPVSAAAAAKPKLWWRPDPATGTWVPEGYEGQMTTSTDAMKSPSRVTRIRTETTASLEDKRWWTSMEELPDMDRANPK